MIVASFAGGPLDKQWKDLRGKQPQGEYRVPLPEPFAQGRYLLDWGHDPDPTCRDVVAAAHYVWAGAV